VRSFASFLIANACGAAAVIAAVIGPTHAVAAPECPPTAADMLGPGRRRLAPLLPDDSVWHGFGS
jgi:hypothetical protein